MCAAMIVSVLTVLMFGLCDAKFSARCSDHTDSTTILTPSEGRVRGRYVLEWCTTVTPDDANWHIDLSYIVRKNLTVCPRKETQYFQHHHTSVEEDIYKKLPNNCSNVCLSKEMDLLFSACYSVRNWIPEHGSFSSVSFHNVSNNYTEEMFDHFDAVGSYVVHGDYVSVHFYVKNVPATDFVMELHKMEDKNSAHAVWMKRLEDECTTVEYEVVCKLRGLAGAYRLYIDAVEAPWTRGVFSKQRRTFTAFEVNDTLGEAGVVPAGAGAAPATQGARLAAWALAGAAAAAGAALLLLLLLRCRRAAAARKHVLRDWLNRVEKKSPAGEMKSPVGPILLVYARECAAAEPVVAALKELLETVAPGQVYDIGSAATLALSAGAGGAWVRALLARRGARALLLQTPALHALHSATLSSGPEPQLEQPLLYRRVVYRSPSASDALVQFALRLVAHAAHHPPPGDQPYRKYYLATLEGLETETLPYAVPFRRYVLPRHATALLRDLAPPADAPLGSSDAPLEPGDAPGGSPDPPPVPQAGLLHAVDGLARAVAGFTDYARLNPNYLMDELLVLP